MYFEKFPLIRYSLDGGLTTFLMTDFFRRVKADRINIQSSLAYDEYDVHQGETPEILADKLYGDSNFHWVILIANEIIDPRWDWPLDEVILKRYVEDKYGLANIYATHHYENAAGDVVHSSYVLTKTAVNNYEYEIIKNEAKRRISVIKPQYLNAFVTNFTKAIQAGN